MATINESASDAVRARAAELAAMAGHAAEIHAAHGDAEEALWESGLAIANHAVAVTAGDAAPFAETLGAYRAELDRIAETGSADLDAAADAVARLWGAVARAAGIVSYDPDDIEVRATAARMAAEIPPGAASAATDAYENLSDAARIEYARICAETRAELEQTRSTPLGYDEICSATHTICDLATLAAA